MLRRFIENRERAHHARDSNRRPLPFEWGLEHVGLPSTDDPQSALREYSASAVAHSDAFYAYEPTSQYHFDGHILTFPSYIETPYQANNTVYGRYFEGDRELAVVVLPQWNCKWEGQVGLCRMLQHAGIGALRLSMPYHHQRKPAETERSEYLVSPNLGRTLTASRQAVADARRAADWLLARGYRKVGLVGTSIGSCIAFLAFVHDERFSSAVFIHASSYYADVVWNGLSTSHLRGTLERAIDLDSLRRLWEPISPFPFIRRLQKNSRPMLMLSGRYDLSFPAQFTQQGYEEFERLKIPVRKEWLSCGHYTMGKFPFQAIVGLKIRKFLIQQK
ncbi:MAG TPA: alpha/beta hydrolase family protein [Terriglobia bacterium]|nr:alpha/beta hydrolase family protein [Terriglobia bacterium]